MVDEDYVGQIKAIVSASTQGTPLHKVPEKVAEKLQWALHFEMMGHPRKMTETCMTIHTVLSKQMLLGINQHM